MKKIAIFVLSAGFLAGCSQPNGLRPTKSASVNIVVSNVKAAGGGRLGASGGVITTQNGALDISSFIMSMGNLRIEENSGNDVQEGGGNNSNDGNDASESSAPEGSEGPENSDIILAGPFIVDAVGGTISLQKIDVFPGTFKKVDFSLQPQTAAPLNGSSIVVKGNFKSGSSAVPFTIQSSLTSYLQLPLQGNGIVVKDKGTSVITITVDVASLLNNLDLSTASIVNGEIVIDGINNISLLKLFEANFAKFTEASE